jgi:hypothetical protein
MKWERQMEILNQELIIAQAKILRLTKERDEWKAAASVSCICGGKKT